MGRVLTPTYRVEYRTNALAMGKVRADAVIEGKGYHVQAWPLKDAGRPTAATAEAWRKTMNASFAPGGANEHITKSLGFIEHINHVRVVRQSTGVVVAEAFMPTFEVV